jgi:predicted dehydrogenase
MTVAIGVVGAGALGFHHTRILRDVPGARLMGFYEADAARADKVSSELGVTAFRSLDALLDVVGAVSVVVPTPAHYAVAAPALERGLHVLIEKPIATTLEEADSLLAIARRTGAVVQTGHVERFNRAVRAALPFVDSPRFIESNRLAPFNPRGSDVAGRARSNDSRHRSRADLCRWCGQIGVRGRSSGSHAVRRHRECASVVRSRRRRKHHGEPSVARTPS